MGLIELADFPVNEIVKGRSNQRIKNRKLEISRKKSRFKKNILQLHDFKSNNKEDTWEFFRLKGFLNNNRLELINYSKVNNILKGKPLAVIGSGFSGRGLNWDSLKNIYTLGINHIVDVYDNLDFLIFQDHRFLRKTRVDVEKFSGLVFAANSNPIIAKMHGKKNFASFSTLPTKHKIKITTNFMKGLYARKSTGLCAVHLALCMGANPIYLIGLDSPRDWKQTFNKEYDYTKGIHIKKGYTGAVNTEKSIQGYVSVLKMYQTFLPYKERIINVCKDGIMNWFKQMSIDDFNKIVENMDSMQNHKIKNIN